MPNRGYHGKILFIDLTSGSMKEESLPEKVYRDFIGGQGLGTRILYECIKPKADPLGPDNMLGFLVGPLTGTGFHGARYQVVGKSPITSGWGDANCGGSFAVALKAAGYDGVFFSGISPKPVFLFLNDGKAELKNASHLWGKKGTFKTEEIIKEELGDKRIDVASIGPGGETKSLLANIMHDGSAASRSGLGAVMGAKRLKAFAVRGTQKVQQVDPNRFSALRKKYLKDLRETDNPWADLFKNWGTCSFVSMSIKRCDTPIKNWGLTDLGAEIFPNHARIDGDEVIKYEVKRNGCLGCPIRCKGWANVERESWDINKGTKPEYQTIGMMGPNCLIDDVEAIIKGNDLCNHYGLDTIGVGSAIAWAMECYERGVITKEDTDGIELTWGNAQSFLAMIEKIVLRDGFGAVLADGTKRAAERIGNGSEEWAMQIGGQDIPAHAPLASLGCCWGYVCDPTPGRHTASQFMHSHDQGIPFVLSSELQLPPHYDPLDMEANAPIYAVCTALDRLWTSVGLCNFALWSEYFPLVEAISALTGWDFTLAEGLKTGRRIQTLRQAFNIREGVKTSEWRIPERLAAVPSTGSYAGRKVDFKDMKAKGYAALGWDAETGKPLESSLVDLGLKDLVGQLP